MNILNRANSAIKPLIKALAADPLVASTVSLLIGSVAANFWPEVVGLIALILLFWAIGHHLVDRHRQLQRADAYTAFELALRQPDSDALARLHAANEHFLVFNRVIEILPHYSLNSRSGFASLGWRPDEILVDFKNEIFDASDVLTRIGGGKNSYDPPNGRKFCLVDRSLGGTDTALSLKLQETDYFTICSVISNLPFALRSEFGSLDPAQNRVPHSLCLHFIVRCGDGSILLALNANQKKYGGGTWSVSAEEQMKDSDLTASFPIDALFKRAILEEVFGLSDEKVPLVKRWAQIEEHIHSIRIWSLFLEEHLNNFSLLGVCQLSVTRTQLRIAIEQLINDGSASRDLEGKLFIASSDQIERLLILGSANVTGLFSDSCEEVLGESLHWTSRYRIFRLIRALNEGPLAAPTA